MTVVEAQAQVPAPAAQTAPSYGHPQATLDSSTTKLVFQYVTAPKDAGKFSVGSGSAAKGTQLVLVWSVGETQPAELADVKLSIQFGKGAETLEATIFGLTRDPAGSGKYTAKLPDPTKTPPDPSKDPFKAVAEWLVNEINNGRSDFDAEHPIPPLTATLTFMPYHPGQDPKSFQPYPVDKTVPISFVPGPSHPAPTNPAIALALKLQKQAGLAQSQAKTASDQNARAQGLNRKAQDFGKAGLTKGDASAVVSAELQVVATETVVLLTEQQVALAVQQLAAARDPATPDQAATTIDQQQTATTAQQAATGKLLDAIEKLQKLPAKP